MLLLLPYPTSVIIVIILLLPVIIYKLLLLFPPTIRTGWLQLLLVAWFLDPGSQCPSPSQSHHIALGANSSTLQRSPYLGRLQLRISPPASYLRRASLGEPRVSGASQHHRLPVQLQFLIFSSVPIECTIILLFYYFSFLIIFLPVLPFFPFQLFFFKSPVP